MVENAQPVKAGLNIIPMDSPLGHRISIVGSGGKSTLAKAIVAKTDLNYIELDALFWKPNWVESTAEELKEKVTAAIEAAPDGWIADGHYWSRIGDLLLGQADMVIWLDLPWRVGFWRMLRRSFQRAWDKNKICGDNTESWRKLFSRDALWVYWITQRRTIIERDKRLVNLVPSNIPVIRLKSGNDLNRFYEVQGLSRSA